MVDDDLRAQGITDLGSVSPDMLVATDARGTIRSVNTAWGRTLGYAAEELVGHRFTEFVHAEDLERTRAGYAQVVEGGSVDDFENRWRHRDGRWRWISWASVLIPGTDRLLSSGRDVTARMDQLIRITRSEALLAEAESVAGFGVWEWQPELDVAYVSPALRELLGFAEDEPFTYGWLLSRVHPEDVEDFRKAVDRARETGSRFDLEYRLLRPDGEELTLLERGKAVVEHGVTVRMFGTVQDVTEQRALERELRHAQRMESIGRLAGGVAHDFNNLLMGITGVTELALAEEGVPEGVRTALMEISAIVDRGASLTRQVLTFSRMQPREQGTVAVNATIEMLQGLIGRVIGDDVAVTVDLAEDITAVPLTQGDLEQILMNLCVNARDAMPSGGRIHITTRRLDGGRVRISVRDDGFGMDPETAARSLEPFFTTKEEGQGTGLGLSTVYGIVTAAGGAMHIDSSPGAGTTILLDLPSSTLRSEGPVDVVAPPPARGSERILVVDDDPTVRRVVSRALAGLGYDVHTAADAHEALALARDMPVDLLLTDVIMPGKRGPELAAEVAEQHPDVRALFMSGYPSRPGEVPGMSSHLPKPFGIAELARRVRSALDGPAYTDLG